MDKLNLSITLNEHDWDAYVAEATQRVAGQSATRMQRVYHWLPGIFIFALAGLTAVAMITDTYGRVALAALLAVLVFTALLRLVGRLTANPLENGVFLGPSEVAFDATGMHLRKDTYQSFSAWTAATDVSDNSTHVFVWIDRLTAQVIPLRELPSGFTAPEFVQRLRGYIANRHAATQVDVEPAPASPPVVVETAQPAAIGAASLPGVGGELLELLKLFVLANARPTRIYGRDLSIALLGALAIAVFVLRERMDYGPDAQFVAYQLPGLAWFGCIALALAWILAKVSGVTFRRTLLLVAGMTFLASLAFGIGSLFGMPGLFAAYAAVTVEGFVFLGRGLTILSGKPQRRAFAAGALLLGGCWYVNDMFYLTPSFWMDPEPEMEAAAEEQPRRVRDQLAFDQALRVDAAVKSLRRADQPESQVFFLGFAGFGDQRVFAEEISLAAKRVDARYGTPNRALRLVNDRRDRETLPWASVSALNNSLQGMAKLMDVERDVLFLSLSSHGSESGRLSVDDGRPFSRDLHAKDLAAMLRESGIRWKVIVISACYAGSFIDDLRDENTVVLTAAAPDRTSFGCSDDRDLTYFGEAFYRDALTGATDLRSAFESARAALAERERAEGVKPSNPQAHFGAAIEARLAEIEAARVAKTGPAPGR